MTVIPKLNFRILFSALLIYMFIVCQVSATARASGEAARAQRCRAACGAARCCRCCCCWRCCATTVCSPRPEVPNNILHDV